MSAYISHTSIDCANAYDLSQWWKRALGYIDDPEEPPAPGEQECMIISPETGHRVLFLEVPERKEIKNRMHFDLRPKERTRDEEVAHFKDLGARELQDFRNADGTGWVVLADPEGNEFCILRSDAERGA